MQVKTRRYENKVRKERGRMEAGREKGKGECACNEGKRRSEKESADGDKAIRE